MDADRNVRVSLQEFRDYVEKMRLATEQRQVLDRLAELQAAYGGSGSGSGSGFSGQAPRGGACLRAWRAWRAWRA